MFSPSIEQLQNLVLQGDAIAPRTFQVFVDGVRIVQANGTNPKIMRASVEQIGAISVVQDRIISQLYTVRIVKRGITAAIAPSSIWELSFDGVSRVPCRVIPPIRESRVQGVSWEIDLELTRNV